VSSCRGTTGGRSSTPTHSGVVPEIDTDAELICTPHQGELVGMGGETADDPDERAALVRSFADEIGHTLLVKGAVDVVSDGDGVRLNHTGNPGMTVGGTGDVLAGAVGALAAVTDSFHAAAVGVYANGLAGGRRGGRRYGVRPRGDGLTRPASRGDA